MINVVTDSRRDEEAIDPLLPRHRGDKLAVLCATRPAAYFAVRAFAAVTVVAAGTVAVDLLAFLFAQLARSHFLFAWLSDERDEESRSLARAGARGLDLDTTRYVTLVAALLLLMTVQALTTRGLPPGRSSLVASIRFGLPWPGRWAGVVRWVTRLCPWLCFAGLVVWAVAEWGLPSSTFDDWWYFSFMLLFAAGLGWTASYLGGRGGWQLAQWLPASVDVTWGDLLAEERRIEVEVEDEANRRWPRKRDLRVPAAVRVFAAPPEVTGFRGRCRDVWWTKGRTSVEALAAELVVQALVDAREAGIVTVSGRGRRTQRLIAHLPPDQQPRGLAELVAGHHREGQIAPRSVTGSVKAMLDPTYANDPFSKVVEIGLEDLESCGAVRQVGDGWCLDQARLTAVRKALDTAEPAAKAPATSANTSARELRTLSKHVARHLRSHRTTEAEGDDPKLIGNLIQLLFERRERSGYQLPVPCADC